MGCQAIECRLKSRVAQCITVCVYVGRGKGVLMAYTAILHFQEQTRLTALSGGDSESVGDVVALAWFCRGGDSLCCSYWRVALHD